MDTRNFEPPVRVYGIDVVRVPGEPVWRRLSFRIGQRYMVERVPGVEQLSSSDVVLLNGRVVEHAVRRPAVLREVHRDVLVGRDPGVTATYKELVESDDPTVLALQRGYGLVVLVDDDVFATFCRSRVRHDTLPPGKNWLAFVRLRREVRGDYVLRDGLEPHGLEVGY